MGEDDNASTASSSTMPVQVSKMARTSKPRRIPTLSKL
jgi:hypothetical protein